MEKVFFNGIELTKYIVVARGFTPFGGADFDPNFEDYPILDGADFSFMRKGTKKLSVPFYNKKGTVEEYDKLQAALRVTEPKELRFSRLPNRVFYAVPSGTLDFEELVLNKGKGTLNFIIADGLAHATVTKRFEFTKNSQGVLETEIDNKGSDAVPINYRIKLKKESGYIGLVSQYGAIQFGKIEEADSVADKKNVLLSENKNGNFSNWTDGNTFYENPAKKKVTQMTSDSSFGGRLGLLPASFSNSGNSPWFGSVKELSLSQHAKDWYIWARAWFETGLMGQTGAWCLAVIDENNSFIAGMAIEKNDVVGNRAQLHFLMGDGNGGSQVKKTINFSPSYWVKDNPYGSEGREKNSNMFDIRKEGDKVTFFWYGSYFSFFESRLKEKNAAKVQFFVGQFFGRNTGNQFVTHHYLNDVSIYKLNVPFWRDVPNRYPAGSTLFIDALGEIDPKKKGCLYVNNLPAQDDEVLGTTFFLAPPGKTKIQLLVSSFSEVGSAFAEIEEAWS